MEQLISLSTLNLHADRVANRQSWRVGIPRAGCIKFQRETERQISVEAAYTAARIIGACNRELARED